MNKKSDIKLLKKLEKSFTKLVKSNKSKKNEIKSQELQLIMKDNGFHIGRMISGSKGYYLTSHPKSVAIFNSNIIVESCGKIWYGDVDITKDGKKLKEVAKLCGETLYILREMDCRFDTENDKIKDLIGKAVWNTGMEVIDYDQYKKSLVY